MSGNEQSFNVIAVDFEVDANAYEALTRLKELDSQGQLDLKGAAVVVRKSDGTVEEKDDISGNDWVGTAGGGLMGLLIGVIGGPLGVLIGGTTGLMIGSLFDLDKADRSESVLGEISESVRVGRTSLLAELTEQSYEVVDAAMAKLGGTVLRRSIADVEAELAAAEHAQREAKKKAREELLEARHQKHQDETHAKFEALKAKLHPDKAASAAKS